MISVLLKIRVPQKNIKMIIGESETIQLIDKVTT